MEEKHPQTIAAVGEYEFPEEIIHQIQSFMDEREAARTTLISKSWYGAWSTRPNLSFHLCEFQNRKPQQARKMLQRYEDLNLNIQTFSLVMLGDDALARELVLKAIKLGVIDLTLIEVMMWPEFVLPDEVLQSQTLATLSVQHVKVDLETMINKPLITSSNLKSLTLSNSVIKSDLWLQFPCLKTLVVRDCHFKANGENVIRIRSPSLECVTICLIMFTKPKLEFDVPNIRKLELNVYDVPRLELQTSSREWESDIRITCPSYIGSVSLLRSLKKFVKLLSPSRVSLALHMINPRGGEVGYIGDGLAIPAVENLTISGSQVSPAFLNALFWSCRPNFVKIQRRCVKIQRRCVRGIEKENVEQFQHLSSLPWNTFLDDSTSHSEEFVRFRLK